MGCVPRRGLSVGRRDGIRRSKTLARNWNRGYVGRGGMDPGFVRNWADWKSGGAQYQVVDRLCVDFSDGRLECAFQQKPSVMSELAEVGETWPRELRLNRKFRPDQSRHFQLGYRTPAFYFPAPPESRPRSPQVHLKRGGSATRLNSPSMSIPTDGGLVVEERSLPRNRPEHVFC